MGAHYVCTTVEGIADVIARTAPPPEPPLDFPDEPFCEWEDDRDPALVLERVLRVCDCFAFLRLRDELRREVLSYVVEISKDFTLRRIEATKEKKYRLVSDEECTPPGGRTVTFAPGGKKSLLPLAASAASSLDTLRWGLATTPAVCTALRADIEAIVRRSGSTASSRAWLEHLYCRRDDALDAAAVVDQLRVRAKLGRRANTVRELYARGAEAFAIQTAFGRYRRNFRGHGGAGTMMFQSPSNWADERRKLAKKLLPDTLVNVSARETALRMGKSLDEQWASHVPEAGPALAHGRLLTIDEANNRMPCDVELLKVLADAAFRSVVDSLSEARLITLVVADVEISYRGARGSNPSDADFDALDSALDEFFGEISTRGEHWITAWTNVRPKDICDDSNRQNMRYHDPARPPLTKLRDVYNAPISAADSIGIALTRHQYGSKCVSLIDIDIADDAESFAQEGLAADRAEGCFSSPFRFISPHVAAKCHTGSLTCETATLKLATNKHYIHQEFIDCGILFVPLVPDIFRAQLRVFIPGIN